MHNTRSSTVINIIGVNQFFPDGIQRTITSSYMIHYRERFDLPWIAKKNQINISSFITWFDLHYNFSVVSEQFKLKEQSPY